MILLFLPKRLALLCLFVAIAFTIKAQSTLRPLSIGDTMPDIPFSKNFNHQSKIAGVSDLKGKLVILDFFNRGCLACVKGMPKMDSLQQKFKENIQVILITDNTEPQIQKLFSRVKLPALPVIVEDTNFYSRLFPHEGDPLHVWIDKTGIVRAITDGHNATAGNIEKVLNGIDPHFYIRPQKNILEINDRLIDLSKEVLNTQMNSYSLFFKPLNEQTTTNRLTVTRDSQTRIINRVTAINIPLITLYSLAYSEDLFPFDVNVRNLKHNNQIEIQTKSPLDIRYPMSDSLLDAWNKRNLASYEIAAVNNPCILQEMQADLERFTTFTAKIEIKDKQSLVLKFNGNLQRVKTKNQTQIPVSYFEEDKYIVINNTLQKTLLPLLVTAYQTQSFAIVDETNIIDPVDLSIHGKISNLEKLKKELKKYGFSVSLRATPALLVNLGCIILRQQFM